MLNIVQVIAKWLKRSLWEGDFLCSNHSNLIDKYSENKYTYYYSLRVRE